MTGQSATAPDAGGGGKDRSNPPAGDASAGRPKLDSGTRLAIERTRVAYDRTMMAWVRTATSLITFGFTVYKFFQLQRYGDFTPRHRFGPREFGLTLVSIGLVSLIMAAWDNRRNMESLRSQYPSIPYSRATALGALIFMLGMAGLIAIIVRD